MMPLRRVTASLGLGAALLYGFLYLPIVVVVAFSFNSARHGGPWMGFTTEWYRSLLSKGETLAAARNTLILATVSTGISTLLGTMLGYGLSRYHFSGKRMIGWMMYLPVVIPDVVMAVALLTTYSVIHQWLGTLELGLGTMILAHVTFQIPFVAIVVRARLTGTDPALEEAAHDLGADAWQTFKYVTLPLLWPGIAAGAALAFTLSIDDFVVSFFTTGPGAMTLPILIYSSVKRGITPEINALATVIVLSSIAGTITWSWFQRRQAVNHSHS